MTFDVRKLQSLGYRVALFPFLIHTDIHKTTANIRASTELRF